MKIIAENGTVIKNEEDFKKYVVANVDSQYLEEYINDNFTGYSDNLNDWCPSEIYEYITGSLEAIREDEDLFEYLAYESYESDYHGFDPYEYEGATSFEICGLEFTIEYEEGDFEDKDKEEE